MNEDVNFSMDSHQIPLAAPAGLSDQPRQLATWMPLG